MRALVGPPPWQIFRRAARQTRRQRAARANHLPSLLPLHLLSKKTLKDVPLDARPRAARRARRDRVGAGGRGGGWCWCVWGGEAPCVFHRHTQQTQNTQTKTPLLAAVGNLADAAATGAGALTNAAATFGSLVADPTQLLAFNGLLGAKGAVKA